MQSKIKVVVLACSHAIPEPETFLTSLEGAGVKGRVVLEPCSSKIEAYQLLRLLATGADLVWVIGCPESQCQLVEGSTRMGRRVAYAQQYLEEIGIEPERLGMSRLTAGDNIAAAAITAEIQARAQSLGLSPCHPAPRARKE
jgi:coenzyme F420-reducing hydrogenase delta subunit